MTETHPPCSACGGPVAQRHDETNRNYKRRKTCSELCREMRTATCNIGRSTETGYQHPPCYECGEPVVRRLRERFGRFKMRACCSSECSRVKGNRTQTGMAHGFFEEGCPGQTADTGLVGQCFAPYDRDPGDGGLFRGDRPATTIETINVMATL